MRGSFYTPRESLIPKGAQKVWDKHSDAVAYLFATNKGRPALLVFYGQQSKPIARFQYADDRQREAAVKRYFAAREQMTARKIERATARSVAVAAVKFEVGKTYYDRSSCDWDTIYSFEIVARTAKQLTIKERDEVYKRGIYVYDGVECCKPHGTYSMCSVIRANKDQSP